MIKGQSYQVGSKKINDMLDLLQDTVQVMLLQKDLISSVMLIEHLEEMQELGMQMLKQPEIRLVQNHKYELL